MKIDWHVHKNRGNHRPVLKYVMELESFERDLAVPRVVVDQALPKPPSAWRSYCYPGEDERAGEALDWYRLITPSHKTGTESGSMILPWRGAGWEFPEVREAFSRVRRDFELILTQAHDSAPLDLLETLEMTSQTREHIAAGVVSARFLAVAGF